jgi:two-component system, cell cycle response regulator
MLPERKRNPLEDSSVDLNDTILTQRLEAVSPCRVLVVDDDDLVRARLTALLRMAEYEVESAASGEDALRIMSAKHCQILLTDWQMPDMDGLSLCRRVRAEPADSYVYVLMLSVRDSKQDLLTGLAAGADDYVAKSAPIEEILARMEVARRITHVEKSLRSSNRENRRLAVTDALTGAYNLRYLMKSLPRELARSQRYAHPLAILSCDIDRFKNINDGFGHEAGNDLLQAFVARTESCIRKSSDWLARVGGDEFIVVLPETDVGGAGRVAEKLRKVFTRSPVLTHAGAINFTASIGITALEPQHDIKSAASLDDLLRAADRGLYASKKLGGNHVTASGVIAAKIKATSRSGGSNGIN